MKACHILIIRTGIRLVSVISGVNEAFFSNITLLAHHQRIHTVSQPELCLLQCLEWLLGNILFPNPGLLEASCDWEWTIRNTANHNMTCYQCDRVMLASSCSHPSRQLCKNKQGQCGRKEYGFACACVSSCLCVSACIHPCVCERAHRIHAYIKLDYLPHCTLLTFWLPIQNKEIEMEHFKGHQTAHFTKNRALISLGPSE